MPDPEEELTEIEQAIKHERQLRGESDIVDRPVTTDRDSVSRSDINIDMLEALNYESNINKIAATTYSDFSDVGSISSEELEEYENYLPQGIADLDKASIEELVSDAQGVSGKLGSGVTRLGATALTKFGEGVAFTGALALQALNPINWGQDYTAKVVDKAADNAISEAFSMAEDWVKEELAPIYESQAYKNGNWIEQAGTVDFWASDFVDGLAFLLSSYGGAALAGKIGMAGKVAAGLGKTTGIKNIAALEKVLGHAGTTAFISSGEAMFEAKEIKDDLLRRGVSPRVAAAKARDAFLLNMAVLSVSNSIQLGAMKKVLNPSGSGKIKGLGIKGGKLVDTSKDLKGFNKYLKGKTGAVGKAVGLNVASEGFYEENAQTAIQNLMTDYGTGKEIGNVFDALSELPGGMVDNLGTNEGQKAIFLGSIIGALGGGAGQLRQSIGEEQARDSFLKAIDDLGGSMATDKSLYKRRVTKEKPKGSIVYEEGSPEAAEAYGEIIRHDDKKVVVKTKEEFERQKDEEYEVSELIYDSEGNPQLDHAAYAKIYSDKKINQDLDYLIDAAYKNKDFATYRVLKGEKFQKLAYEYYNAGLGNEFLKLLEEYKTYDAETLAEMGYTDMEESEEGASKSHSQIMDDYIKDAKELKKIYDTIEKTVVNTGFRKKELDGKLTASKTITALRKKELKNLAAREYFVNKELNIARRKRTDLLLKGEASNLATQDNEFKTRISKLDDDILDLVAKKKASKDKTEIAQLREKEKEARALRRDLKKKYKTFLRRFGEEVDMLYTAPGRKQGYVTESVEGMEEEKRLSPVAKTELNAEEVKIAELANVRDLMQREVNKLLDPTKGYKYYIDNVLKLNKLKTAGRVTKMSIRDLLIGTYDDYIAYEEGRVKSARVKQSLDQKNEEDFDDAVRQRIAAQEPVVSIIQDILELKPPLSRDTISLVERQLRMDIRDANTERLDLTSGLEVQLNYLKEELQYALDANDFENIDILTPQVKETEDQLSELIDNEQYRELSRRVEGLKEYQGKVRDLKLYEKNTANLTDQEIKVKIAKDLYSSLVKEIKQNFELNEEYDNEEEINTVIAVLRQLGNIFKEREGFESFSKEIEEEINSLVAIRKEIKKRKEDKERKQTEIWENYTKKVWNSFGIYFEIDEDGKVDISYSAEEEKVIKILKDNIEDFEEIIDSASKDNMAPIYADILLQKARNLVKEDAKVKKELKEELDSLYKLKFKKLIDIDLKKGFFYNGKKGRLAKTLLTKDQAREYFASPERFTDELIILLQDTGNGEAEYDLTKGSAIDTFIKDKDIINLKKNLLKEIEEKSDVSEEFPESTRQAIYDDILAHEAIVDTYALRNEIFDTSYDIADEIETEIISLNQDKKTPAPTAQQVIALRALIKFISKPIDTLNNFDGWAYLKGFAGTGKTNVTLKWAINILGIKNTESEIYAFGHTDSSTKTVINSINSLSTASLDGLLKEGVPEVTKLIVIDEVGAISKEQLIEISKKISDINSKREVEDRVKVITLGDPNQRTVTRQLKAPIDQLLLLPGSANMVNLPPLTVRYRSNVGPVVSFQDLFMGQRDNMLDREPLVTKSNTPDIMNESNEFQPLGVFGTNSFEKNITRVLKAREGSKTSKAVIVNDKDVEYYKQLLKDAGITDVEVLDVYNVQGRTIDEVYINLKKDNSYLTDVSYNTDIYTATSRAAKFIYIGEIPSKNELDIELSTDSKEASKKIASRRREYEEQLDRDLGVINKYYKEVIPDTGTEEGETVEEEETEEGEEGEIEVDENGETAEERAIEVTNDDPENIDEYDVKDIEVEIKDEIPLTENEVDHIVAFPEKTATGPITEEGEKTIKGLEIGDKVEYVLTKWLDKKTKEYVPSIVVVKKISEGTYRRIAVIGNEDITNRLPEDIAKILSEAKDNIGISDNWVEFSSVSGDILTTEDKIGYNKKEGEVAPIYTGTIKKTPTGLKYIYNGKNPEILTRSVLQKIVKKFKETFFSNEEKPEEVRLGSNGARIRIFTKKDVKEIADEFGIKIQRGVPYLYFKNPTLNKGSKKVKPQFIRLSPRKINTKVHPDITGPILSFIKNGKILESIIGSPIHRIGFPAFNELINELGRGNVEKAKAIAKSSKMKHLLNSTGKYDILEDEEVLKLAKILYELAYYDTNNIKKIEENDWVQHSDPTTPFLNKKGNPKRQLVETINGDEVKLKGIDELFDIKDLSLQNTVKPGPLQRIINRIAKSNLVANDHLLRQEIVIDSKLIFTGKALLTSAQPRSFNIKSVSGQAYITRMAKRLGVSRKEAEEKIGDELLARLGEHWTLDKMEEVFSFDKDGNSDTNGGFGLRIPIPKLADGLNLTGKDWNNKQYGLVPKWEEAHLSDEQLERYFENTFEEVTPNNIVVTIDPSNKNTKDSHKEIKDNTPPPPEVDPENPFEDFEDPDGGLKTASREAVKEPGRIISKEKAIAYLKKILPSATEDQLKFIDSYELMMKNGGIEAWGAWSKGIIELTKEGTTKKILRHEIFHEVWNRYLTIDEQLILTEAIFNIYGPMSEGQLEEKLAELYQDRNSFKGIIKQIFNRIAQFFNFYARNRRTIDRYLDAIDSGKYTVPIRAVEDIQFDRLSSKIRQDFKTMENYKIAKNFFFTEMYKHTSKYDIKNGKLVDKKVDPNNPATFPKTHLEAFLAVFAKAEAMVIAGERLNGEFTGATKEIRERKKNAYTALSKMVAYSPGGGSKATVFTSMIKDAYPNYSFKPGQTIKDIKKLREKSEDETKKTVEQSYEDLENNDSMSGIFEDHIQESDQVNQEKKISQSAKDFVSLLIPITKQGKILPRVNPRYAYIRLLQTMPGIDWSNLDTAKDQLESSFRKGKIESDITTKTIYDNVIKLISKARAQKVYSDTGGRINIPTVGKFLSKDVYVEGDITIKSSSYPTNFKFFEAIYNKSSIKDYNAIVGMYNIADAKNTLRELIAGTSSQRRKNVKLGTETSTKDKLTQRYISLREYGFVDTATVKIEHIIGTVFSSEENRLKYSQKLNKIKSYKKWETQRDSIQNLLNELGILNKSNIVLSESETDQVIDALTGIILRYSKYKKAGRALSDSVNDISILVDVIIDNTDNIRTSNYTAGDGTRRYMYMLSSRATDTLRTFAKGNSWMNKPSFFDNLYFENNMYLNKDFPAKIHNYIDHDSIKNKFTGRATPYKKETKQEWVQRNLMYGFGSVLRNSGNVRKYAQQFWTPSDKPNIIGAEVTALNEKQLKKAIRLAIYQESARPEESDISNYSENKTKSYLTGLDTALDPSVSDIAFDMLSARDKAEIERRTEIVFNSLNKQTEELLDYIIKEKIKLSASTINYIYKNKTDLFGGYPAPIIKKEGEEVTEELTEEEILDNIKKVDSKEFILPNSIHKKGADLNKYREHLRPFIDLFVKNNYVNGYFLNQLVAGDQSFYKNSNNVIKRMSLVFAQGTKGFVNEEVGMKETFTVAVGKDINEYLDKEEFAEFKQILGKAFDISDGAGFILPERKSNIELGFGESSNVTLIQKPVYWGIDDTGVPRGMKYSTVELTDDLVEMFPRLSILRDQMRGVKWNEETKKYDRIRNRKLIADEFVFFSAFKVGAPNSLAVMDEEIGAHTIEDSNIVTLKNENYRIQQQAYHDVTEQSVSQPTQLNYFLNSNGKNNEQANEIYNDLTSLMEANMLLSDRELRFSGKESKITPDALRKVLLRSLESNPTSDNNRIHEFLSAKTNTGEWMASLDTPFMIKKIITMFSSTVSKNTVEIKFDGAKLSLQTAYGVKGKELKGVLEESGLEEPKWRNEQGYAEVYMPDMYKGKFNVGDIVHAGDKVHNKFLSFRIPSTEMHSALPIMIKGFYPTTEKNENVIIAPKEIVFFHGSDYDIDALYVIRHSISSSGIKGLTKKGKIAGFKGEKLDEEIISKIDKRLAEKLTIIRSSRKYTPQEQGLAGDEYQKLLVFKSEVLKNKILEQFLEIVTAKRNEKDMFSPISMDRFNGTSKEEYTDTIFDMLRKLYKYKSNEDLYSPRDLNNILDQANYYRDNMAGKGLTGVFANSAKAIFYSLQAARNYAKDKNATPTLKEDYHINLNGGVYSQMSLKEQKVKDGKLIDNEIEVNVIKDENGKIIEVIKDTPTINQTIDMLINAAIDNVNEQILSIINTTIKTKDTLIGLVSLGIPLTTVTKLMLQPVTFAIGENSNFKVGINVENSIIIDAIRRKIIEENKKEVTEEEKEKEKKGKKKKKGKKEEEVIDIAKYIEENKRDITDKVLEESLTNYENWQNRFENLTAQQLVDQLEISNILEKADKIGSTLGKASIMLKRIQQLPVLYPEIQEGIDNNDEIYEEWDNATKDYTKDENGNRILSENWVFTNTDYMNIPHINYSFKILRTLKRRIQEIFLTHNKQLVEFSDSFNNRSTLPTLYLDTNYSKTSNSNKNSEIIRDEFVKYVLNGLTFKVGDTKVDLNTVKEKDYVIKVDEEGNPKEDEDVTVVTGTQAWIERFADRVIKLQRLYPSNTFLNNIQVKHDWKLENGAHSRYLLFTNLGTMENEDIEAIMEDFEKLNEDPNGYNEIQTDFLKYAILANGLGFSSQSYSTVLPPKLYENLFKALDSKLSNIFNTEKSSTLYLERLRSHFGIQLALNNMDAMKNSNYDIEEQSNGKWYGEIGGVNFDIEIKKDIETPANNPTKFIKLFNSTLYVRVLHTEESSYYQKIGKGNNQKFYYYSRKVETDGYDLNRVFDTSVQVDKVLSNNPKNIRKRVVIDGVWKTASYTLDDYQKIILDPSNSLPLPVGSVIRMVSYSDKSRTYARDYKINKVRTTKAEDISEDAIIVHYSLEPTEIDYSITLTKNVVDPIEGRNIKENDPLAVSKEEKIKEDKAKKDCAKKGKKK